MTLHLGDCLELLPQEAAVVLTDPPYGQQYKSGWATDVLWAAGRTITGDVSTAVRDKALVLIGDTPALVFGSRKRAVPLGTKMVLTWDKGPALGMGDLSLPWKPSTEEIYVIGKGWIGARDEGSCVYHPPVQSMAKNGRLHPNEKPVGLLQRLLRKCPPGAVLDPFMGVGSTGAACIATGRPFIGIEIEETYFDLACRRLEKLLRQPQLFAVE